MNRIEMNIYDEKASKNLIEFKKKDEHNMNKNTIISIVYAVTLVIGILVCFICDVATSGMLSWSLITFCSILFAWIALFPMILLGKKGIFVSLVSVSVFIIPLMYILSILLKVREVFQIGTAMSVIALIFLWVIFAVHHRLKNRKFLAMGITFLLAIPLMLSINITLSKMIHEPVIDAGDIIAVFIFTILAFAFIIGDYARKKAI